MSTKSKIIIGLAAITVAFAFGRYSAPEKVRIETKTVTVEKQVENKDKVSDKDKHKKTRTIVITKPDGTKKELTTTTEDTKAHTDAKTNKTTDTTTSKTELKEVTKSSQVLTLSALLGTKVSLSTVEAPAYGLLVNKQVLGPITIGLFGFTNGFAGGALGVNF